MEFVRPQDLPYLLDHQGDRPRLVVADLTDVDWSDPAPIAAVGRFPGVVIGHASAPVPNEAAQLLEALTITCAPSAPGRTWVDAPIASVVAGAKGSPLAAAALATLMPLTTAVNPETGVVAESLAYSMLLAGPEFAAWRSARPRREVPPTPMPVLVERNDDVLTVRLNRPERRNAFGHELRDALLEALRLVEADAGIRHVELRGTGTDFSSGGDLDEFGTATDVATAHVVRLLASAGLAVHRLRDRVYPVLHGACIGAGVEVPAFADHVVARPGAWFQLPELRMGLVPGAGGTVSVTRRIGRWRTAYLVLSGAAIDSTTALAWGLIDELTD